MPTDATAMKYAFAFLFLGFGFAFEAVLWRGPWWLLLWPSASFVLVGLGYGWLGPRVFGKRADGRMAWPAVLALLPYLLFAWGTWRLQRLLSREPNVQEIAPGIWIGRRPLRGDVPDDVSTVVDLTAEFRAARSARLGRSYRWLPTLDARPADPRAFTDLARELAAAPDPILIHCAQGHGRSGMLAAAVLIVRGLAGDVDGALSIIQRVRPGVRLSPAQRATLDRLAPDLLPAAHRSTDAGS